MRLTQQLVGQDLQASLHGIMWSGSSSTVLMVLCRTKDRRELIIIWLSCQCIPELLMNLKNIMNFAIIKETLHPFALSFASLETQSYFWMAMVYSLIFLWDGRNKDLSVLLPAYCEVKIVILCHNKQEVTFHLKV